VRRKWAGRLGASLNRAQRPPPNPWVPFNGDERQLVPTKAGGVGLACAGNLVPFLLQPSVLVNYRLRVRCWRIGLVWIRCSHPWIVGSGKRLWAATRRHRSVPMWLNSHVSIPFGRRPTLDTCDPPPRRYKNCSRSSNLSGGTPLPKIAGSYG